MTAVSQLPWFPGYVPWSQRPEWERRISEREQRRGPFPGQAAFWVDSEIGGRGVQVVWVEGERAGVTLNVPYAVLDYEGGPGMDAYRRAQERVRVVPVADLRETMELANLAATGRAIVRRAVECVGAS